MDFDLILDLNLDSDFDQPRMNMDFVQPERIYLHIDLKASVNRILAQGNSLNSRPHKVSLLLGYHRRK